MLETRVRPEQIAINEFKSWLEAQPLDSIAGDAGSPIGCPFARFLLDKTGEAYVVGSLVIIRDRADDNVLVPLPTWAIRFVSALDEVRLDFSPVSVKTTLDVLQSVQDRLNAEIATMLELEEEGGPVKLELC